MLHRLPAHALDVDLVVLPQPGEQRPIGRLVRPQVVGAVLHAVAVVFEGLPELVEHRYREVARGALHAVFPGERRDLTVCLEVTAQGGVHPLPLRRLPARGGQHVRMTSQGRTGVGLRHARPGERGGHKRRASHVAPVTDHNPLRIGVQAL